MTSVCVQFLLLRRKCPLPSNGVFTCNKWTEFCPVNACVAALAGHWVVDTGQVLSLGWENVGLSYSVAVWLAQCPPWQRHPHSIQESEGQHSTWKAELGDRLQVAFLQQSLCLRSDWWMCGGLETWLEEIWWGGGGRWALARAPLGGAVAL